MVSESEEWLAQALHYTTPSFGGFRRMNGDTLPPGGVFQPRKVTDVRPTGPWKFVDRVTRETEEIRRASLMERLQAYVESAVEDVACSAIRFTPRSDVIVGVTGPYRIRLHWLIHEPPLKVRAEIALQLLTRFRCVVLITHGGDAQCIAHEDCAQHPALGCACWRSKRAP